MDVEILVKYNLILHVNMLKNKSFLMHYRLLVSLQKHTLFNLSAPATMRALARMDLDLDHIFEFIIDYQCLTRTGKLLDICLKIIWKEILAECIDRAIILF